MFPRQFPVDDKENAQRMAMAHVRRYYPTRDYDEDAFANRSEFGLNDFSEVTRKDLENSGNKVLRQSGIYLIMHENGQTVYVGLANDFHGRFCQGSGGHSADCGDGCGHWGHFVVPTTGARMAGLPDANCRFFILEIIEHEGFGISQAEIDWYYLFRTSGWNDRGSQLDLKLTNMTSCLGAKGGEKKPLFVYRISSGVLRFFASVTDAAEEFECNPGDLSNTLEFRQNQNGDITARWATKEEIELDPPRVLGDSLVTWVGEGFNSSMYWRGGALSEQDLERLRSMQLDPYQKRTKSWLHGIACADYKNWYDEEIPRWRCYYIPEGGSSSRSKIVPKPNEEEHCTSLETELRAAEIREEFLMLRADLQPGNPSNSSFLNTIIGKEKYPGW